jgi:S1-C subfamily serine protease
MLRFVQKFTVFFCLSMSLAYGADSDTQLKALFTLAEQGNATAQNDLGVMYQAGSGVPQDYGEAVKWLRKSAEQGLAIGQYNLGARYAMGQGVAQNSAEALKWYRLAAAQGHGASLYNIAVAYINSQDVPRDYVLAAAYFDLAATSLSPEDATKATTNRDNILTNLNADQKKRVQAIARVCRETHFKTCEGLADARKGGGSGDALQAGMPGAVSTGTGFFVNADGYLVTNAHVVEGCASVRSPKVGVVQKIAVDKANDLAILKSATKSPDFARLKDGRVGRPGETVVAVGYPYAGALRSSSTVTTGVIAALTGMRDDARILQMTAPVQHGNSGGPLLGPSGAVIGVVNGVVIANEMTRMTNDVPQNINFAIVAGILRGFLDANHIVYQNSTSDTERKVPDIAEDAMKFTVLLECGA